jgi:hypothetical protein
MRNAAFLFLVLAAGCAGMTKPPAEAPPAVAASSKAPAGTKPVEKKPTPKAPATKASHPSAASTASAAPATAAAAAAPAMAAATAGPHLDLKGLERRLKDTHAIGLFTKLALKNQVDDLLAKFRAYHDGQQPPTLTDLRPNYELLIMKVQSLIQKDDPALADDVARSREVIWAVLADKSKFTAI